jgi:Fe-S-cluster-containing hydrogenase component 2
MHAARNVTLCTKDCLCLFICPTGATDTENGQIDFAKCLDGCRLCVDACPSHAIYLVHDRYPHKPAKDETVVSALGEVAESKAEQEAICEAISIKGGPAAKLAKALAMSNRILAEDATREGNYMLPLDVHTKELLEKMLENNDDKDFPADTVKRLLSLF